MCISEIQEHLKEVFLWNSPAILPVLTYQIRSHLAKLYKIRDIKLSEKNEFISNQKFEQMIFDISPNSASIVDSKKQSESITCSLNYLNTAKKIIDDQIVSVDDFWEAPIDKIKIEIGRANDDDESLLYTTNDIKTAQLEKSINLGDFFILITYKLKTDQFLEFSLIGTELFIKEELSDSVKEKLAMVVRFFTKEATRNIGEDRCFYRVTNAIAKFIREYSGRDTDGWAHTSAHAEIQNINRKLQKTNETLQLTTNFCLFPDRAHAKLEIESVQICISGENNYAPVAHLENFDANDKPKFKWII